MRRFFGFGKREEEKPIRRSSVHSPSVRPTVSIKIKACGHGDCQLSSADTCCECGDKRPISNGYKKYVDGEGNTFSAEREEYYCPACKYRIKTTKRSSLVDHLNKPILKSVHNSAPPRKLKNVIFNDAPQIIEWACPHSPIATDCRICSEETPEQRAIKDVIKMGFNLQQVTSALNRVKRKGLESENSEVISSRILDELLIIQNEERPVPNHVPKPVGVPKPVVIPPPSAPPLDSDEDDNSCKICFENAINSVLIPCGHLALCHPCAISITKTTASCPICRKHVSSVVQTFKV